MALDIELYCRTIYTSVDRNAQKLRRISVIDIHPEEATRTLVLIHGYGGSAIQWLYQLQFFGQTMRVVAPDMRGHGMSDDPENLAYSMHGLVDDLELVLDHLEVQRPFHLIAHSFGGAISTEYALRHPEEISGLVLIGVPTRFILRAAVERLMLIPDPLFSWIAKAIRVALFAPQRTLKRMLHSVLTPWRGDERVQLLQVPTLVVLALLQYTSGPTDNPKGMMLSHGNLVVNIVQIRHWMPDARRGREVVLCALPLSHSYGVTSCMNTAIGIAGTLVLLPTSRIDRILEAIKNHHPTIFPGIPALYLAIANYPRVRSYGVAAIRTCISGSAPLPVEVQEEFEKLTRGRLVEGYGLTEASPVTHSNPLKGERHVGSIGIPLPETNARIVDLKTGQTLPAGEVGELLISGPQVMQGYWNMPEETQEALKDGWLHTGDLARMDEDGFFTIVDRKKDLILAGSYNVYPRDVEEVLYEHPKILEVVVISTSVSHDRNSELPKNFVGKVLRRLLVEA